MKEKKPITRRSAKQKGSKFQKDVAQKIADMLGVPCGKDELVESRESSQSGVDIKLIGDARRRFPWSVECKNQQNIQIRQWVGQASTNRMPGTEWILFVKKNHFKPVAIIDYEVAGPLFCEGLPVAPYEEYDSKTWKFEQWVDGLRATGRKDWCLCLKDSEHFLLVFDLDWFMEYLDGLGQIKGVIL